MNNDLTRREFVALVTAGAVTASTGIRAQAETLFAYVGSWTQGPFGIGGGGGITIFSVDMTDGSLTRIGHTGPEFENMNAGYLAVSPDNRFLYATNEIKNLHGEFGGGGGLVSFAIDPDDGSITHLNTVQSMGVNPAYVTIDATGTRVLTSNHGNYDPVVRVTEVNGVPQIEKLYDDGTVAIFPVNDDGTLAPATDVAVLERVSSVDPVAQQSAHAHSVNFDPSNSFVLVCDKGGDRIYTYRIDPGSYTFADEKFIETERGLSPRHSVFHPTAPFVFVINERASTILSLEYELATHELRQVQSIATIPADFAARNTTADIRVHPNGRFLYGSNRGHDSIAVYEIDESAGTLELLDIVSTLGQTPRNFNFDPSGRFIFVCNQGTNSVVSFEVDPDDGSLTATGAEAGALKPACIKFASV